MAYIATIVFEMDKQEEKIKRGFVTCTGPTVLLYRYILRIMKSRRMTLVRHVARMEERRNGNSFIWNN
jgi:hypothetical protein